MIQFYFSVAIAKDSFVERGEISLQVKPTGGKIDRAGGRAFGIRNIGNYFVLRGNALEDNLILFEFVNSRRLERQSRARTIKADQWHLLRVVIDGSRIAGYLETDCSSNTSPTVRWPAMSGSGPRRIR